MYIRTSCGVLGILKHIKLNMYEFNNERYIKNGIRLHNSYHDYTIKLRGDNKIDVLEIDDLLFGKYIKGFVILNVEDYQSIKLLTYVLEDVDRIITHEQYLPLAQEVL